MHSQRLKIVSITIAVSYFVVLGRLFYWQIIKYSDFKQRIIDQSYKASVNQPERGLIYDSQMQPLVLNKSLYYLSVYKPDLKIKPDSLLSFFGSTSPDINPQDALSLQKFFLNDSQKWLTLKSKFSFLETQKLKDPGLTYTKVEERFYPEDDLGRQFLGTTKIDSEGNLKPLGGLESYYDRQLKGRPGFSWETKDATGKTLLSKTGWQIDSVNGRSLITSINRQAQHYIESALRDGVEKYSADSGSITIMSPATGEIIAMASFVASSSAESTPSASRNPVITDLFEPGSIFKPLVMSMALDSKSIGIDFVCAKCDRPHQIGEYSISNWDSSFHADSNLKDIIKNSDNIGMSYIIQTLGLKKFLNYFQTLGLTQKTGIDLQGEVRPVEKSYWPEIDLATASFGQGFAITQIQMLTAFNAIANDGILVRPHLVSSYIEDGQTVRDLPISPKKVFDSGSISKMKEILKYSVENGVVSRFKPDNLEVCAKSGTSEVAVKGGYSESSTIASYVGFSPCNSPTFSMIVTINNPRSSPWGSSTAAPVWYDIADKLGPLL